MAALALTALALAPRDGGALPAGGPCDAPEPVPLVRSSPIYAAARTAAQAGRVDEALALLESWRPLPDAPPAPVLAWLEGRWLEEAGRGAEARDLYHRVAASPLDDDARLREGRLWLDAGDAGRARSAFAGIPPSSRHWTGARLGLAEALVREGRAGAARVVVTDVLRDDLDGPERAAALAVLARADAAAGRGDGAATWLRAAWVGSRSVAGTATLARALGALGRPPSVLDGHLRTMARGDPAELKRLAKDFRRRRKAVDALDPGLEPLARGLALRLDPRARDRAQEALDHARAVAVQPSVQAAAALAQGNLAVSAGDDRSARARYADARDLDPAGPAAADATLSEARCLSRLGDPAGAAALLESLAASDPPVMSEARLHWEAALAQLLAGRLLEARPLLERLSARLDLGPGLPSGPAERALYFRAVARLATGSRDEAVADLRRVARNDPHSWYGVLARERLRDLGLRPAASSGDPTCLAAQAPAWLWRLGYRDEAADEVAARSAAGLLDEASSRVLAVLAAAPGEGRSSRRVRDLLRGDGQPAGDPLADLAYPRPYADEVAKAAAESGLDPALIYGVMRVESGFNPKARSNRGAVGLLQLLPATAKRVAALVLGDGRVARGLARPSGNIRLGAAYLGELSRHFQGHLPLVLAGYHAGPGAARRFHRTLGRLPTELFVEALPFQDTVSYVKQVVAFAAGYRAILDADARGPLVVDARPPSDLGPFFESRDRPAPPSAALSGDPEAPDKVTPRRKPRKGARGR